MLRRRESRANGNHEVDQEEARGRACRVGGVQRGAPRARIDYSLPGAKNTNNAMALLVRLDFESTAIESADVMGEGTVDCGTKVLVQALQFWGCKRVVMSCDQEIAIVQKCYFCEICDWAPCASCHRGRAAVRRSPLE